MSAPTLARQTTVPANKPGRVTLHEDRLTIHTLTITDPEHVEAHGVQRSRFCPALLCRL